MIVGGEEFNPQVKAYGDWVDLTDSRFHTWYKTEAEARVAIENHKHINEYVPRIIEVE